MNGNNSEKRTYKVSAQKFAEDLSLRPAYPIDGEITFTSAVLNRPGLLLSGFDGYFPEHRVQAIGNAELAYLDSLGGEEKHEKLERLFSKRVPCVIVAQNRQPSDDALLLAKQYGVPLFITPLTTAQIDSDLMHYLTAALAETDTIHGELLDISGIGVLLIGESGIGKSETALELIHRGHLLVADDLVEVKRIKNKIYGYPSEVTNNLLEVRGVGLINVEAMFGVSGVLNQKRVHLVIEMEKWDPKKSYDRLGNEKLTCTILGMELEKIVIPVSAGRNLAVVIEAASRNFRLKHMGKDALDELYTRLMEKNRPRE